MCPSNNLKIKVVSASTCQKTRLNMFRRNINMIIILYNIVGIHLIIILNLKARRKWL